MGLFYGKYDTYSQYLVAFFTFPFTFVFSFDDAKFVFLEEGAVAFYATQFFKHSEWLLKFINQSMPLKIRSFTSFY